MKNSPNTAPLPSHAAPGFYTLSGFDRRELERARRQRIINRIEVVLLAVIAVPVIYYGVPLVMVMVRALGDLL